MQIHRVKVVPRVNVQKYKQDLGYQPSTCQIEAYLYHYETLTFTVTLTAVVRWSTKQMIYHIYTCEAVYSLAYIQTETMFHAPGFEKERKLKCAPSPRSFNLRSIGEPCCWVMK